MPERSKLHAVAGHWTRIARPGWTFPTEPWSRPEGYCVLDRHAALPALERRGGILQA